MEDYQTWKLIHIFMLTFWLGTDMGVMLTTIKSGDSSLSPETRFKMVEMALVIELIPRFMWTLAFAFGVHLSIEAGYLQISSAVLTGIWVLTTVMLITNCGSAFLIGKPLGETLTKINKVLMPTFGLGVIAVGISSMTGNGPFMAEWLGLKIALFGLINITAISILFVFEPIFPSYIALLESGSTPELEKAIKAGINKTLIPVITTYVLIAVVAIIGVYQGLIL